jgi:hypothetical protein
MFNQPNVQKNDQVAAALEQAKAELSRLREEKLRLYPPNPHPLAQPDDYPSKYTPEQIRYHNELTAKIEVLELRVEELERRLYSK